MIIDTKFILKEKDMTIDPAVELLTLKVCTLLPTSLLTALVSTEALDVSMIAALNGLPTISPDTVTVSRSNINGGYRYTVTFNSGKEKQEYLQ